jgi:hypothetical protein
VKQVKSAVGQDDPLSGTLELLHAAKDRTEIREDLSGNRVPEGRRQFPDGHEAASWRRVPAVATKKGPLL